MMLNSSNVTKYNVADLIYFKRREFSFALFTSFLMISFSLTIKGNSQTPILDEFEKFTKTYSGKKELLVYLESKLPALGNTIKINVTHSRGPNSEEVCYKNPRRLYFNFNKLFSFIFYTAPVSKFRNQTIELAEYDLQKRRWQLLDYNLNSKKVRRNPPSCVGCHGPETNPHLIVGDYNVWPGWDIAIIPTGRFQSSGDKREFEEFVKSPLSLMNKISKKVKRPSLAWKIEYVKEQKRKKGYYHIESSSYNRKAVPRLVKINSFLFDVSAENIIFNNLHERLDDDLKVLILRMIELSKDSRFDLFSLEYLVKPKDSKFQFPLNKNPCTPHKDFYLRLFKEYYTNHPITPIPSVIIEKDHLSNSQRIRIRPLGGDYEPINLWNDFLSSLDSESIGKRTFLKNKDPLLCGTFDGKYFNRAMLPFFSRYILHRPLKNREIKLYTESPYSFSLNNFFSDSREQDILNSYLRIWEPGGYGSEKERIMKLILSTRKNCPNYECCLSQNGNWKERESQCEYRQEN